jgi:hypothetical protein
MATFCHLVGGTYCQHGSDTCMPVPADTGLIKARHLSTMYAAGSPKAEKAEFLRLPIT